MLISLAVAVVCLCGLYGFAAAGFRLGDQPEDTQVTAVLRGAWQPDATRPVIAVTIRNPSGTAVLAGMSVRAGLPFRYRLPSAWPGLPIRRWPLPERAHRAMSASAATTAPAPGSVSVPMGVSVPRRTARRRFHATLFDTVGVVPAGVDVQFSVPVPEDARGYVLTAVVGQRDRRLRVHRIALAQGRPRAATLSLSTSVPFVNKAARMGGRPMR